jgi:hypothetical protein
VHLRQHTLRQSIAHLEASSKDGTDRAAVIELLRQRIQQIEGRPPSFGTTSTRTRSTLSEQVSEVDPAGFDMISGDLASPRDLPEDGGTIPCHSPPPVPPSSLLSFPERTRTASQGSVSPLQPKCIEIRPARWTFGKPEGDVLLGSEGLDPHGVHEIKPALSRSAATSHPASDWNAVCGAARTFALALAARRLVMLAEAQDDTRAILWCGVRGQMDDLGTHYAPGLATFGIAPERFLIVEVGKPRDALWAIEEALKTGSLALVIGMLETVHLTPARRLALAAQTHATPCIVLTHPAAYPMAATASRWRIAPLPSAPHILVQGHTSPSSLDRVPGPLRLSLGLERHRARSLAAEVSIAHVEWCHETLRFRMASPVRDRTHDAGPTWRNTA